MTESKSLEERLEDREDKTVRRDGASAETVMLLNELRSRISDPAAAQAVAILHAQINGFNQSYQRPQNAEKFPNWFRNMEVSIASVGNVTSTGLTATVSLDVFNHYQTDAEVWLRFSTSDGDKQQFYNTSKQSLSQTGEVVIEVPSGGLDENTEYDCMAVASASHTAGEDVVFSDTVKVTTE